METDLGAALAHQPDAVVVSNPTALHLEVAIPAVEQGCHLLLEKPVSHSLEGLDVLRQAAEKSRSRILVGFQFRYHPALRKAADLIDEQVVGRPVSFSAHWGEYLPNWHPWEDYRKSYSARQDLGGGVVLTLTHPLDYLHWLFGPVERIWAFAGQFSDLELDVVDTAVVGMAFENRVVGSLQLNYLQRPPHHHLEIVCSGGTIRWEQDGNGLEVYSADNGTWQIYPLPERFERDLMFRQQMRHFLQVVRGEADPFCTLSDGITALEMALAVHRSGETGRISSMDER